MFGLVTDAETELGYVSLSEIESFRGRFGLKIERDLYFNPKTIAEIKAKLVQGQIA